MFLIGISVLTIITSMSSLQILLQAYRKTAVVEDPLTPIIPSSIHNITTSHSIPFMHVDTQTYVERLWASVLSMPMVMLFGCFTLLCAWSLTSLLIFHGMIISVAQTTNERVRNIYQYGRVQNTEDHGCFQNWKCAFCNERPRSLLPSDFTDIVVCDHSYPETLWKSESSASISESGELRAMQRLEEEEEVNEEDEEQE